MSGKEKTGSPVVELIPAPTLPPKVDLRNASAIRREMAAVYRDMRGGVIEPQVGTKLAYVLTLLGDCYDRDVLETRIEKLEQQDDED